MSFHKMSRLERNCALLRVLLSLPKKERNKLLKSINKSCIDSLRDCCRNILFNEIPIKPEQKSRLQVHKAKLRAVANRKVGSEQVRKHFQTGGFFQALIPVLASIVGPILSSLAK